MARPFAVTLLPEQAYLREVMFALELLDAVTLERVTYGVDVTAVGLAGTPIVNHGGLFVWLKEPTAKFQKIVIDPRLRPFERVEIPAAQMQQVTAAARPTSVELRPLANYPFTPGITVIRGSLYETKVPLGTTPVPLRRATIRVEWMDEVGNFQPGTGSSVTNDAGDFVSILRFAPDEEPEVSNAKLAVRLFARRTGAGERFVNLNLPQGRVTDGTYAWDELQ